MVSCFHCEKAKISVLRPVRSDLTWFNIIAHLFMFSASLKGNEHTDVSRAALVHPETETNTKCACTVKNDVAVFSMYFSFRLGYIGV